GREAVPEGRQAALQGARRESAAHRQGEGKKVGTTAGASVKHSSTSGYSYPVTVTASPPDGVRPSVYRASTGMKSRDGFAGTSAPECGSLPSRATARRRISA